MCSPSSTSALTSHRGAGLFLLASVLAIAATACGGSDITTNNKLTIGFAGGGRGTVTGSPGSINCSNTSDSSSGTCEADVGDGTEVTLSATAEDGSTFTGWTGDAGTCGASTPCTMTISEPRNIIANFKTAAATQTLTIAGGGPGTGSGRIVTDPAGIDCTITGGTADVTTCSGSFPTGTSVQLQVQAGTLVGWGGACDGATCSVVMSSAQNVIATFAADAQATQLAFVSQPGAVQVSSAMAPVQVAVEDAAGQTVAGRTDAITLRIGNNPGGATLGGQFTRNAENGVATFSDLTLDKVGDGYTLTASASGLPDVTSDPFNVTATAAARLAFTVQPHDNTTAGTSINPAVQVSIQDSQGAILTDRTDQITISLGSNPTGGTLRGTKTATAVGGVATFSGLTIQKAGAGYILAARAQNASGATSSAFTIVAGPPRQLMINSAQSQKSPVGKPVSVKPSVKVMDGFNNPVEGVPVTWVVTAPANGGIVDPAVQPTGPQGISTVSWTLGQETGTENNELRASVDPSITGTAITFKASGTLPPGQGVFKGVLSEITNVGFPDDPAPISDATLKFFNLTTQTAAGEARSKSDGSFVSPPLPGGGQYKIDVTAGNYKPITYQKPNLNPDVSFSLDTLGMVRSAGGQGTAGIDFTIRLNNPPANSVHVRLDVYSGYYVGDTVDDLIKNTFEGDTDVESGAVGGGINPLGDWGVLTIRVSAPGYETQDRFIVVDKPTINIPIADIILDPVEAE